MAFSGGDVVAAWRFWDGTRNRVQIATGRLGMASRNSRSAPQLEFDPPREISQSLHEIPEISGVPRVAIGAGGHAFAIWSEQGQTASSHAKVHVAVREPGADFGEPVQISRDGRGTAFPKIAAFADGGAIATWVEDMPRVGESIVKASIRPPGGDFEEPVAISNVGTQLFDLKLAANSRGDAAVTWREPGAQTMYFAAARDAGEDFQPARRLSPLGAAVRNNSVSINENGLSMFSWVTELDDGQLYKKISIKTAMRYPGEEDFGPAWQVLTEASVFDPYGRVTLSSDLTDDGRGATVWNLRYRGTDNFPIELSQRNPSGSFDRPLMVNRNGGDPSGGGSSVQFDSDGDLAVVSSSGYHGPDGSVDASTVAPDGEVTRLGAISSDDCTRPRAVQTSADESGNVMAIWQCYDPQTASSRIEAAIAG